MKMTSTTSASSVGSIDAVKDTRTAATFEYAAQKVKFLKCTAIGLTVALIIFSLALTILGTIGTVHTCQDTRFSSYTPLIAVALLACCLTSFCSIVSNKRSIAIITCLINSIISVFLLCIEALSLRCTWPGTMPTMCYSFRRNANLCQQLINVPDEDDYEIPEDNFRGGRVSLLFLALASSFASVTSLIVLSASYHTTGQPVYLHRQMKFVVGDPKNVKLAFDNLDKNVIHLQPTNEERKNYDAKRVRFGGTPLVESTLPSEQGNGVFKMVKTATALLPKNT